jgi:hypothetical protein
MSEDRRQWNRSPVSVGEVGVANARGDHPDEYLVRPRLVQLKLCEFERVGALAKNSRGDLHGRLSPRVSEPSTPSSPGFVVPSKPR